MARPTYRIPKMKRSRIARRCDLCGREIKPGEKYGKTARGTIWCERCK